MGDVQFDWEQAVQQAIAEAQRNGDFVRTGAPAVFVRNPENGREELVEVCPLCYGKETFYRSRYCGECAVAERFDKLCPRRYRRYSEISDLTTGPEPWSANEVAELQAWPTGDSTTLGLIGPPGRRKTSAMFAKVLDLLRFELRVNLDVSATVAYTTVTEMLVDLQANQFEPAAHSRYSGPDILLLDELGDRAGLTDWQRQQLHLVIEQRYREEKVLLWTSNLSLNALRKWCHERTWERLWDGAVVLQIAGQSTRQIAA